MTKFLTLIGLLLCVPLMAADREPVQVSSITGGDELYKAGVNSSFRLLVDATQSGTWTTGRTWTLSNGTDSIAAVQSGTWNINNITGTVSLPTGASTAANQSTIITSVQLLDDVVGSKAPGTAATSSALTGCVYNSAGVTLTNAQQAACQMDASGNVKVAATFTTVPRTSNSFAGAKYDLDDMNAGNGGVARGTGIASTSVYTQLYSYTGSGHLFNFLVSLEGNLIGGDAFNIKLEIDGITNFEINTLDVGTGNLYDLAAQGDDDTMSVSMDNNVFQFAVSRGSGLYYATSIKIYVKKATSATSKQFRAGLISLTKET